MRFVIDEVVAASAGTTGQLAGRVDPERIGLFGLSLGSLTVWSEVFDDPSDPPIDALIQSDGTTLAEPEQIATIGFPVLVAHSDVDPIFPYADVLTKYDLLPGTQVPAHAARCRPRHGRREHGDPGRRGVPAGHDGLLGPHPGWPPGDALPAPDRRRHVVPRRSAHPADDLARNPLRRVPTASRASPTGTTPASTLVLPGRVVVRCGEEEGHAERSNGRWAGPVNFLTTVWRRRWGSLALLALLVALAGGMAMAGVAGARRSASSPTRFEEAAHGRDLLVAAPDGDDAPLDALRAE